MKTHRPYISDQDDDEDWWLVENHISSWLSFREVPRDTIKEDRRENKSTLDQISFGFIWYQRKFVKMNNFYGVMIKWVSYQDAWLYSILDTHYCKRELVIKSPSTIKGTQVTNLVQFHLSPILNKRCHRLLWINCDYPKYFCIIGTQLAHTTHNLKQYFKHKCKHTNKY